MHAVSRARRRRGTTVAASLTAVLATALTTVVTVLPTSTAQAAVPVVAGPAAGPIDPNTGYPFWYADGTGEKFELCLDRPDTAPGMCLAAPRNPTARPWVDDDPAMSNLAEDPEAFWYNADADIRQGGVRARFIAAQEATFGGADGSARAGEQIAFGRVRVRLTGMVPGADYTVTDPYDTVARTYTADDGGRVFVTRDIGCLDVPCDFTKPYKSSVTSYLRWDPSVGPAAPAGYVGDPNVTHEVVGAPSGNNFFRVVGPDPSGPGNIRLETNQFNVQGKLWNPTQPMLGLDSTQNLVDFGKVMLGSTTPVAAQTVTLTNAGGGTTPLQLGALAVSGQDSTQFAIVAGKDTCSNASLLPGATCTVDVSYTPSTTVVGPVRARLDIPSTNGKDSDGGQRVPLRGRVSDGTGKDARVTGPIDPVNGFPQWYQDETGQRVALCDDPTDPMCVLPTTPEGTYDPALPMKFATNYPGELFWWNADASIDNLTNSVTGNAVRARLVLAEEAAFVNGDAAPGDQIAFGRIRIRVSDLQLGETYHVTTPYLERDFVAEDDGKGGGEINYTEDLGCLENPCNFDRVNQSNIGPFLRQTNAPEGYLGDPNVTDTVTGGPVSDKFVISGPGVAGETDQFAVSGKLLTVPAGTGQLSASSTTVKVNPGQQGTAVTLTNVGNAPSAIPTVALVGSGFGITNNGCTAAVAPGASCTVTVGVTTAKPGDTAILRVTNGTQAPVDVTLQRPGGGNAAPTAPALAFASNTGISAFDTLTRLNTVTVSGAAATGQPVQVLVDGTTVQTVTAVAGTFSTQLNLTQGVHTLTAAVNGVQALTPTTVTVDTTAPQVSAPQVDADVAGGPLTGTVSWSAPGAAAFTAQVRHGQGAFVPLELPRANATSVQQRMVSADGYRFRVRATDAAGNTSDWAATSARASVVQDRSEKVQYDGHWVRRTAEGASGHRVRSSATRGSTATIRTTAETVDIVAPTGPQRGLFAVRVNGRHVRTVDLYSARPMRRQTVATLHGLSSQQASVVQVRVLGTKRHASGGTRVTLDAFLLTR